MPMRAYNALATFQSLINQIFHDCIEYFMVVYIDDLLLFRNGKERNYRHIEIVQSRLKELYVSPKKCNVLRYEKDFLGLLIAKDGIRVNVMKVKALRN